MARRKKPQIKGTDPSYDHSFERFRAIPNDLPSDVVVPGVEKAAPTPKPAKPIAAPKPKRVDPQKAKPSASKARKVVPPVPVSAEIPNDSSNGAGDRQTTLDAAVKVKQAEQMAVFEFKEGKIVKIKEYW